MRRITVTTARLNKEHHLAQAVNLELFVDVFGVSLERFAPNTVRVSATRRRLSPWTSRNITSLSRLVSPSLRATSSQRRLKCSMGSSALKCSRIPKARASKGPAGMSRAEHTRQRHAKAVIAERPMPLPFDTPTTIPAIREERTTPTPTGKLPDTITLRTLTGSCSSIRTGTMISMRIWAAHATDMRKTAARGDSGKRSGRTRNAKDVTSVTPAQGSTQRRFGSERAFSRRHEQEEIESKKP